MALLSSLYPSDELESLGWLKVAKNSFSDFERRRNSGYFLQTQEFEFVSVTTLLL